jgi:hypothetical protein
VCENEGTFRTRLREGRSLKIRRTRDRPEWSETITAYRVLHGGPELLLGDLSAEQPAHTSTVTGPDVLVPLALTPVVRWICIDVRSVGIITFIMRETDA